MKPPERGEERIGLEEVPRAEPELRANMRRTVGDELLGAVREADDLVQRLADAEPTGEDVVFLHPASTASDLMWLNLERARIIASLLSLHLEMNAADRGWVGDLRTRVKARMQALRRAGALCAELGRFNDLHPDGASALEPTRRAIAASVHGFRAGIEALVAESREESARWLGAMNTALMVWEIAQTELEEIGGASFEHVSEEDVLEHAFGARPAGPIGSLGELIGAYQDLDPHSAEHHRPSGLFRRLARRERRLLARGDRIIVFAERQLRSVGFPAPPLGIETVHDCFQLGWRLARQACPTLAHICARQAAHPLMAALARDGEAMTARLLAFNLEDAPLIIDAAPRAERAIAAGATDPVEALSGHRQLLEALVRPWLRFVLDLLDVCEGRSARGLPATVRLGQLVREAEAAAGESLLIPLLVGPIDTDLRHAGAHERARVGLDGLIHVHGDDGVEIKQVSLAEIEGRFWALRSAFAGVDCAASAFVHGLRLEVPEGTRLALSPWSLQRIIEVRALAHGEPSVRAARMEKPGLFLLEVDAPWSARVAQQTAEGVGRLAEEVDRVVFRSPNGPFPFQ